MSEEQQADRRRPRVAVVFGGRSGEHAVSVITAANVLAAIDHDRYEVVPIGITPDGHWVLDESVASSRQLEAGDALPSVDDAATPVVLDQGSALQVSRPGEVPQTLGDVDVVFPVLHGPYGEDGTLQGLLELAGVRYVGAGVLSSAIGMDKQYMKVVLGAAGLPMAAWLSFKRREWEADAAGITARVDDLGYPVFVKPARAGSSLGISKVRRSEELAAAVSEAQRHDPKVVIEKAVTGVREIECGVLEALDGGAPDVSVCAEIEVLGGDDAFYDFDSKYRPEAEGRTRISIPAPLDETTSLEIRTRAATAFEALACEGLARVDFFVDGEGQVLINEVNTMPGFTPTSMFPQVWKNSGLDYESLVDRLLQLALQRDPGLR